jgi:hypothetical protein
LLSQNKKNKLFTLKLFILKQNKKCMVSVELASNKTSNKQIILKQKIKEEE